MEKRVWCNNLGYFTQTGKIRCGAEPIQLAHGARHNKDQNTILRYALTQHFNLDELKDLCNDAGLDLESVPYAECGK